MRSGLGRQGLRSSEALRPVGKGCSCSGGVQGSLRSGGEGLVELVVLGFVRACVDFPVLVKPLPREPPSLFGLYECSSQFSKVSRAVTPEEFMVEPSKGNSLQCCKPAPIREVGWEHAFCFSPSLLSFRGFASKPCIGLGLLGRAPSVLLPATGFGVSQCLLRASLCPGAGMPGVRRWRGVSRGGENALLTLLNRWSRAVPFLEWLPPWFVQPTHRFVVGWGT